MPLAAALAADGIRPASFLPAVKCSDCGIELQIEEMGSHVCETPTSAFKSHNPTMSNPFTLRRLDSSARQNSNAPSPLQNGAFPPGRPQSPAQRQPRIQVPKINPDAANQPFLAPRSPLATPISPSLSMRSGFGGAGKPKVLRSMTSPAPRLYDPEPPSPELSTNLDCAFPPFPTAPKNDRRPSTSHGRKTPTGSERALSRGGSRLDHIRSTEPEPFYLGPQSPTTLGKENVLQKLDSMTSGPFDVNRRKDSTDSKFGFPSPQRRRPSEPASDGFPPRPSTASSTHSQTRRPSVPAWNDGVPDHGSSLSPPRMNGLAEEESAPSFLNQLSAEPTLMESPEAAEPVRPVIRNNTYPYEQIDSSGISNLQPLSRMLSEPSLHEMERRPSLVQHPPRSDSRNGARLDFRLQDAPPVPKAVQQYRLDSAHVPSESGSSITSGSNSALHTASSGASPASSVTGSVDAFSPTSFDSGKYEDERVQGEGLTVSNQQRSDMRTVQPISQSPSGPFMVPNVPEETPQIEESLSMPLEPPMEPVPLKMRNMPGTQYQPWQEPAQMQTPPLRGPREQFPVPPPLSIPAQPDLTDHLSRSAPPISRARSPSNATSVYSAVDAPWPPSAFQPPPPVPAIAPPRRQPTRRGTNAKPMCRGCGLMIEGKSVKAADGRLTGRWHKACFVCRSCQQPFTTADFYVINDEPYCEHDYHEKNGSLCQGCNRGIEGQYLETSSSTRFGRTDRKFHPRCFTCCECRMVLAQDYFEIQQKVYCERHALAAMRAQARLGAGLNPYDRPGLPAERRTTRLINPIMA